jgi:hypothetical protein
VGRVDFVFPLTGAWLCPSETCPMLKTHEDFAEYLDIYNAKKDLGAFFDRYYHADATFDHPLKGVFHGRDEIVGFWSEGHAGIHEIIKDRSLVIQDDMVAADLIIEWHCTEDTEYLGPKKKGQVYNADCAAFYKLDGDKVRHVRLYLRIAKE